MPSDSASEASAAVPTSPGPHCAYISKDQMSPCSQTNFHNYCSFSLAHYPQCCPELSVLPEYVSFLIGHCLGCENRQSSDFSSAPRRTLSVDPWWTPFVCTEDAEGSRENGLRNTLRLERCTGLLWSSFGRSTLHDVVSADVPHRRACGQATAVCFVWSVNNGASAIGRTGFWPLGPGPICFRCSRGRPLIYHIQPVRRIQCNSRVRLSPINLLLTSVCPKKMLVFA